VKKIDVTVLHIDGRSATEPDYPYIGPLALIFKEKNATGSVKNFVEFASSEAARDVIKEIGGIPVGKVQ